MNQPKFRVGRQVGVWAAILIGLVGVPLSGDSLRAADEPTAEGLEFFEKKIRPLLVKNCYTCHGPEKQKGGLRLDSRAGWIYGGDSGPAIVPGKPEESLLIEAVHYAGFEMPPTGKLPAEQIAAFEQWVKLGAPDPRLDHSADVAQTLTDPNWGRQHWAYQPPSKPAAPQVLQADWPRGEIDRFILAGLEAQGLPPAQDASRETLVRRLYFDLIGLPPTPEEIDRFVHDEREDAYEQLVDQLLASRHYGERWGRHWLDVARFAESVTLRGFIFPEAWRYRDYVIEAFHRDLPYDRFVQEQIAGDLLPAEDWQQRQRQMIATTFWMLGNINYEEQDKKQLDMDVVDEQLDTLGKAFLAQTIGCARCHDHKFDPIPTKDYYALAGILRSATAMDHANVSKWIELPLPLPPEEEQRLKEHESAVAALQEQIKVTKSQATQLADSAGSATLTAPDILVASDLPGIVVDSVQAKAVGQWQHSTYSKRFVGDGYLHDMNAGKGSKTLTFQSDQLRPGRYEVRLSYVPASNRAQRVPVTILHADGESTVHVNQELTPPIAARFVSLGQYRFEQNQGFVLVSNEGTQGHVTADAVQFLPLSSDAPVQAVIDAKTSGSGANQTQQQIDELQKQVKQMEKRLQQLSEQGPQRPRSMALREEGKFVDLPIHIRGSVHNLGEVAPRGFLQVATPGASPTISSDESGRRQLAEWLASRENPLTARVMANRVWHWLMGAGIVRTTDNFGTTGETPSHPELLDYLSARFVDQGWSVKQLVREIVLSRTYQLSTQAHSASLRTDPENRLLSHMHRRRLDAEALRDSMLLVSGQLRHLEGGPTFKPDLAADYGYKHADPIRSVYLPIFRNSLPDIFEAFDYPDPSMVSGRRNTSTVSPQALFFMNHPFVREQAEAASQRLLGLPLADDATRLEQLYRGTLGRSPSAAEREIALTHLRDAAGNGPDGSQRVAAWAVLYQSVFASPDFRYLE